MDYAARRWSTRLSSFLRRFRSDFDSDFLSRRLSISDCSLDGSSSCCIDCILAANGERKPDRFAGAGCSSTTGFGFARFEVFDAVLVVAFAIRTGAVSFCSSASGLAFEVDFAGDFEVDFGLAAAAGFFFLAVFFFTFNMLLAARKTYRV